MKNFKVIIVILIAGGLGLWAFMLANKEDSSSKMSDEALSDFAIEDTASIDKLILTDTEGNKGVTLIRQGVEWTTEDGECVQQHLVQTILMTIKRIMVKSPVPKSSIETVNKNLTTHHRKVQIYQNGELKKTWYVGQPTQDQYGTYMLLKDPEKGKSPEPFIMHLPNMHGNLETRFITNPLEFECTDVFVYNPLEIKTIDVQLPDSSQYNFKITALGKNEFNLSSNGKSIPNFDTVNVRNYILGFKKIHFEQHNYLINQKSADSLKSTTPWYIIEVTDKEGESRRIRCFRKKMTYERYDYDGNLIIYDRDRLWVELSDGRLVVGQFYVFDKILRDLRYFLKSKQPS
ncbi:MAG: hypothetical protein HUJ25_05870 [Crocinitomicaceae bacterium]|nr:hypothetical protein [Crocinitomicaceae bacterium]